MTLRRPICHICGFINDMSKYFVNYVLESKTTFTIDILEYSKTLTLFSISNVMQKIKNDLRRERHIKTCFIVYSMIIYALFYKDAEYQSRVTKSP